MTNVILITGSSGFVGTQVLQSLNNTNAAFRLVIRTNTKLPANLTTNIERVIRTPDLFAESESWWAKTCEGVDTTLHMAWYTEPGKYQHSPKNIDCLNGTLALARGCIRASVRRFVGIGTCLEYDLTYDRLSTHTPLNPLSPYAHAKAAVYKSLLRHLPANNIEFAWCRIFYLYGIGEDERRLAAYIRSKLSMGEKAYLSGGNQIRDWMDVREAGEMIAEVVVNDNQGAINICSGKGISVRQFAEKIADEYGRRDLLRFGKPSDKDFNPQRVVGHK